MKQLFFFVCFCGFILGVTAVFSIEEKIAEADRLHREFKHTEALAVLKEALSQAGTDKEKASMYWRLSRETLYIADDALDAGEEDSKVLDMYSQGEAYADQAISFDPNNYECYYWKASNIGKWGKLRGILSSLFKAKPMRDLLEKAITIKPDHAASYYVLGQLYEKVPGGIVSFGNKDYAVSLGRLSVHYHQQDRAAGLEDRIKYDYHTELARHLWERNWDASRRKREQKAKRDRYYSEKGVLQKAFYYEGIVELENISDREEARKIVDWVVKEIEALPNPDKGYRDDLSKAYEALSDWGIKP
ncbi:MAG: hypothetical protein DRP87_10775 [Spirochaetes bacterium]|nr:MAG: hypothetical protein DRP87_10775 [Spirochaetota bacterium]